MSGLFKQMQPWTKTFTELTFTRTDLLCGNCFEQLLERIRQPQTSVGTQATVWKEGFNKESGDGPSFGELTQL